MFAQRCLVNSKSTSAFHRHLSRKLDNSQRIPPIKAANGAILVEDNDKVEAFNEFFTSVFTHSDPPLHVNVNANSAQISAPVDFSVSAVCQALRRAKPTTSSGPDGIPSVFWANMSNELALPVSIIFSLSYKFAVVPADWQHAIVTPLHKKGDASQVSNFRPISLTCTLCKVMESMINSNLQCFSSANSLIGHSQHGFLPGRSARTQLLESQLQWRMAQDNGVVTDVILIDFSKAFDVVPHHKLIRKLASLGVCAPTLHWISAFLSSKTQLMSKSARY